MTCFFESLLTCALFTAFVALMARNPVKMIFNYPPAIVERAKSLGLVDESNKPKGKVFFAKKIAALLVFGIILGLIVRFLNDCHSFWRGALLAYFIWCVVNWFDALVLDCLWFCHDKRFVIKGTEDMTKAYHDYWFHIKGGFIGMLLGIPAALIAGLIASI